MSFTVVYAKDTGHVLGALSVNGPAGPLPKIEALVGKQLPLRVGLSDRKTVEIVVPADRLGVGAVNDTHDALVTPFAFGVEVVQAIAKPALLPLTDWGTGNPVTLATNGVTVTLPDEAKTDLSVLVVVAGAGAPLVHTDAILRGEKKTTVRMTLGTGEYGVLTLVQGWVGRLEPLKVP